ncbi:FKBP-type peptidyl-prolyl cis-trans isomerase [Marinilabiliaceae bacterium ANBcel2]|nr:FKBP-type peptidyl-prolyl cis-trans isomerase [Marinilabiliaceae bacterium ANBcel2]
MMLDRFFKIKFFSLILFSLLCSCSQSQTQESSDRSFNREAFINVNRQLVNKEQEKIKEYIEKNDLDLERTDTGLWYSIEKEGEGDLIVKDKVVHLEYELWLLDGTLVYSSEEFGEKVFLVGQGGVESGLEEGILMLKKGSKATFILPSHLAHGLIGDSDRIPFRSSLKYFIKVVDVTDK